MLKERKVAEETLKNVLNIHKRNKFRTFLKTQDVQERLNRKNIELGKRVIGDTHTILVKLGFLEGDGHTGFRIKPPCIKGFKNVLLCPDCGGDLKSKKISHAICFGPHGRPRHYVEERLRCPRCKKKIDANNLSC